MIPWLLLFNIVPEHLTNRVGQEKDLRSKKIKKEETKLLSYIGNMTGHIESPKQT